MNGADVKRIVSGVMWTLANEWLFYLSLPFSHGSPADPDGSCIWDAYEGWFFRCQNSSARGEFIKKRWSAFSSSFANSQIHVDGFRGWHPDCRFSGAAQLHGCAVFLFGEELGGNGSLCFLSPGSGVPQVMLPGTIALMIAFALIIEGENLFGFLSSRPVRFLGIISTTPTLCTDSPTTWRCCFAAAFMKFRLEPTFSRRPSAWF